jgi:hypothetical protein
MFSKKDLLVSVLVLLTGFVMYEFTPMSAAPGGGVLLASAGNGMASSGMGMANAGMETGHYVGSALAIFFGIIGLALYKEVNKVTFAVSVLSILLGLLFLTIMDNWPLHTVLTPHPVAMASIAELTMLVGVIGIVGSAILKPSK